MSTVATVRPEIRPRWDTLQILKGWRVAIMLLEALLLVAAIVGADVHRAAMETVGEDSAPSIIAAQQIKSALAEMDAMAADELLGPPGARIGAVTTFDTRREEVAKALIAAAGNIRNGDTERQLIQTLEAGAGRYQQLVQRSRDLREAKNPKGIEAYRDAAQLLDEKLLPAADALDTAKNEVLQRTYRTQSGRSVQARTMLVFAGITSLVALFILQLFLSQRTRRTFNLPLLAATLLTFGLMGYALSAMNIEQHALKAAKEEAFDSIHATWRGRASLYRAKGSELRYLADPGHAAVYERAFFENANMLARLPGDVNLTDLVAEKSPRDHVAGFTGYLADELDRSTTGVGRETAGRTLMAFKGYLDIDSKMRELERQGQHLNAVGLCTDGTTGAIFGEIDHSLGETLKIKEQMFRQSITEGEAALSGMEVKASVTAAAIGLLVFLGLAARIREYE